MNLFRENPQGVEIAESRFKKGLSDMYVILIGKNGEYMMDTRINFGNVLWYTNRGKYHT